MTRTALPRETGREGVMRSVTDAMPEKFANVLIAHTDTRSGEPTVEEAQHEGAGLWCLVRTSQEDGIYLTEQVTHWRPLPTPPAERNGGEKK